MTFILSEYKLEKNRYISSKRVVVLTKMKSKFTIKTEELFPKQADRIVIQPYFQEDLGIHDHHFFEFVYITGGTTVQNLNETTSILEKGDFFLVDYGSAHSYANSRNLTLINCMFKPEMLDDTLVDCHSFEALLHRSLMRYCAVSFIQAPANRIFHDKDGKILALLNGMQEEYERKAAGYEQILKSRLTEILIFILREVIPEKSKSRSSLVRSLMEYADGNYQTSKTLGQFCREHHFSLPYVSRRFHQEAGLSFREYLQKVRIERSCELLVGTDGSIGEIAQAVGYSDVKFFTGLFKRLVGYSPGKYRKMF